MKESRKLQRLKKLKCVKNEFCYLVYVSTSLRVKHFPQSQVVGNLQNSIISLSLSLSFHTGTKHENFISIFMLPTKKFLSKKCKRNAVQQKRKNSRALLSQSWKHQDVWDFSAKVKRQVILILMYCLRYWTSYISLGKLLMLMTSYSCNTE